MQTEIVLSQGSANFHRFLSAVLADTGIATRLLLASEMPEAIRQRWSGNPEFEAACLVAAPSDEEAAKALIEYTIQNCKVCLYCEESFVRPSEHVCPKCGKEVDPRHPDEIRAQYERAYSDRTKRTL